MTDQGEILVKIDLLEESNGVHGIQSDTGKGVLNQQDDSKIAPTMYGRLIPKNYENELLHHRCVSTDQPLVCVDLVNNSDLYRIRFV